jgi:hypothetical protein
MDKKRYKPSASTQKVGIVDDKKDLKSGETVPLTFSVEEYLKCVFRPYTEQEHCMELESLDLTCQHKIIYLPRNERTRDNSASASGDNNDNSHTFPAIMCVKQFLKMMRA